MVMPENSLFVGVCGCGGSGDGASNLVLVDYGFVLNCVLGCGRCSGCVVVAVDCWQPCGGYDSDFPRLCLMSCKYYFNMLYIILVYRIEE